MVSKILSSRNYKEITAPYIQLGQFGPTSKVFQKPRGLCIDPSSQLVYIVDRLTGNVQICNLNGDYIGQFGEHGLTNADSITIIGTFAFITNFDPSRIYKFSLTDFSLISETDNVVHPFGITSSDDELFVSETDCNRISVFNPSLSKKRQLDNVRLSWCWSIQIFENILFALEVFENCIVKITIDFGLLIGRIYINQDGLSFSHAYYFCMDNSSNFFITDYSNHIKILSPSGKPLSIIDTKEFDCFLPRGIAVDKNNSIVVVFRSGAYSMLVF
ncbi:NHL repeat containing protein [Oopsacas minuta]|uniref:NHL repeat containing protein n=1 Tax=Oopsacas minuta TaxID=111878 RepID=A0AAV7JGH7_9METZ|nr:NHL repeat containing protein [Oopsacas minuta]